MTIRAFATILVACALSACGYKFHLPDHGPGRTAAVTMRVGETKRALSEGIIPLKFGYQMSLASEDPEIVDVHFRNTNPQKAEIWLVAKQPGTTTVHYGNHWALTYPFGRYEQERLGVPMPQDEFEHPAAGKGWPRWTWLRENSAGAFAVTVLPAQ